MNELRGNISLPKSLYSLCLNVIGDRYNEYELETITDNIYYDIQTEIYLQGRLCQLSLELCNIYNLERLLKTNSTNLYNYFQSTINHGIDSHLIVCKSYLTNLQIFPAARLLNLGWDISEFFSNMGFYKLSQNILNAIILQIENTTLFREVIQCNIKLIEVSIKNSNYSLAFYTLSQMTEKLLPSSMHSCYMGDLLPLIYSTLSDYYYIVSLFDFSYFWAFQALFSSSLNLSVSTYNTAIIIKIFHQISKICLIKRCHTVSKIFAKMALTLSKRLFLGCSTSFLESLITCGFYHLNTDYVNEAVIAYELALNISIKLYGPNSLKAGMIYEDLAYALYVREYNTGMFKTSILYAENALAIYQKHLSAQHILVASSKRVKALILEEIAIDNKDKDYASLYLKEALELHNSALKLTIFLLGQQNLQTAKHYGNLGRLFQSMGRLKEAEQMHLKAIEIKETLLGHHDHEVALSLGHLASLYNYDMSRYNESERLYLRSISIGLALYGPTYSGLEYDYRGLIRLYTKTGRQALALHYRSLHYGLTQFRNYGPNSPIPSINSNQVIISTDLETSASIDHQPPQGDGDIISFPHLHNYNNNNNNSTITREILLENTNFDSSLPVISLEGLLEERSSTTFLESINNHFNNNLQNTSEPENVVSDNNNNNNNSQNLISLTSFTYPCLASLKSELNEFKTVYDIDAIVTNSLFKIHGKKYLSNSWEDEDTLAKSSIPSNQNNVTSSVTTPPDCKLKNPEIKKHLTLHQNFVDVLRRESVPLYPITTMLPSITKLLFDVYETYL